MSDTFKQPYEVLLDVAKVTIEYALEHPDCPDYHRLKLGQLRNDLDGMYGAVLANRASAADAAGGAVSVTEGNFTIDEPEP